MKIQREFAKLMACLTMATSSAVLAKEPDVDKEAETINSTLTSGDIQRLNCKLGIVFISKSSTSGGVAVVDLVAPAQKGVNDAAEIRLQTVRAECKSRGLAVGF